MKMNQAYLTAMVEAMPVAVMLCDLNDFKITYANAASIEALRSIAHVLPVPPEDIVGQSIDIFHKDPSHQRKMLADPRNLPHKAMIQVGEEYLDLLVSPIMDGGKYVGPMLTWSVATDIVAKEAETARLMQMMDEMPINVMMADKDTLEINYINKTSIETLRPLQSMLPIPVDQLKGACIDVFHKHPEHQRRLLADASNLPHRAKIKLGDETLDLRVSAINDPQGNYIAPMVSWAVVTRQVKLADDFENNVASVVQALSAAAAEMQASASSMSTNAGSTSDYANTVAAASEELSSSIREISSQVMRAAEVTQTAVGEAERSNAMVRSLAEAAEKIGDVVKMIQDIASQTNLLALNATIEAARAGDAGKGFAVVASEVKALANQTANATEEIAAQISTIQNSTGAAVDAIGSISTTINTINEVTTAISSAVEEQGAATQEVTTNITQVTSASSETGRLAGDLEGAVSELAQQTEHLKGRVDDFLGEVRAL